MGFNFFEELTVQNIVVAVLIILILVFAFSAFFHS